MKKIVFILLIILVALYIALSLLSPDKEYTAEKLFFKANKTIKEITINPDAVPPAMRASAEETLKAILAKYPKTTTAKAAQMALAEFYIYNKKYDDALKSLDAVITTPKQKALVSAKAYFLKGNIYETRGDWDKALAIYTQLRDKYSKTIFGIQIPLYIADYYKKNDDEANAALVYNEAVTFYKTLEAANRDNGTGPIAADFLVQAYLNLKDYGKAADAIEYIIDTYPVGLIFNRQLRNIEYVFITQLKKPQKAIEIYNRIIKKTNNKKLKTALEKRISSLKSTQ